MLNNGGDDMGIQNTLKALSDPTRREILNMLKSGTKSAGEISDAFDISFAAISRHLSVLKDADLIRDERNGKFIYYTINVSVLEETLLWIKDLKGDSSND
jgi:DNA-binding transcriptional ArsR family regulator